MTRDMNGVSGFYIKAEKLQVPSRKRGRGMMGMGTPRRGGEEDK